MSNLNFGSGDQRVKRASVGGTQPARAIYAVRVDPVTLDDADGKEFLTTNWKITKDPMKTGSVGMGRDDRQYLPYDGQDKKKAATSYQFLVRFAEAVGVDVDDLTGEISPKKFAKIVNRAIKANKGLAFIHYDPYNPDEGHDNSRTAWLLKDEFAKALEAWRENERDVFARRPGRKKAERRRDAASRGAAPSTADDLDDIDDDDDEGTTDNGVTQQAAGKSVNDTLAELGL